MENSRIVVAWVPMRAGMSDFDRRINSRITSQKPTIRIIRKTSLEKTSRLTGVAMTRSKAYTLAIDKTVRNVKATANFLKELTKPSN